METLQIRVKKKSTPDLWYEKDKIYTVYNMFSFAYYGKGPHFIDTKGGGGIALNDVEILALIPEVIEYTKEELVKKLGHNFVLKSSK